MRLSLTLASLFIAFSLFAQSPTGEDPIADDFSLMEEKYFPGFGEEPIVKAPVTVEKRLEDETLPPSDDSGSIFDSISNLFSNRSVLNFIFVIVIVSLFVVYKLRSGRRGGRL